MPTGNTNTGSLGDSQQTIIDGARIVREYEGVWRNCVDVQRLSENTGLTWEEIALAKLSAQAITETTELNNPQQISDSLFSITPTMVGVEICITDRVYRRMPKSVIAKMGALGQNAMDRKKDADYLATFAGATTTLAGTGTTLGSSSISSAVSRIRSNTTEPGTGRIVTVLQGYQLKDIQDEVVAPVGTESLEPGLTSDTYRNGFEGRLFGTDVFRADNITLTSTPDARGAVHAVNAIVLVQGKSPWTAKIRNERLGGGADTILLYDEYALGERSAGNWLFGILSDATVPS